MYIEELFRDIFRKLASDPTDQHKAWAADIWTNGVRDTDTHPSEWNIGQELVDLGLARYKDSVRSFEYKDFDY
jgi:hypothetical protein